MEVLGDVLSISERQYARSPSAEGERRAWLYALARWACLRKLTEQRQGRRPAHAGATRSAPQASPGAPAGAREVSVPPGPDGTDGEPPAFSAEAHRRELALLAWPEAAGTTPEQREVLELAVRHQLGPRGVASVLTMELTTARELLASAACEVERTRAALAVVETGTCPSVARLTGDSELLLSSTLRRELVRHVDDCPRCRRTAERVEAAGPWPGAGSPRPRSGRRTPAVLPLVVPDREAAFAAMLRARRARSTVPRFGRNGFPLDPKDHAARRNRLRARAVTTTVVATVIAAPVLALWAAYRDAPRTGEGHDGSSVSSGEPGGHYAHEGSSYGRYENAGNATVRAGGRAGGPPRDADVSVKVVSPGRTHASGHPGAPAAGSLTVMAEASGGVTTITLTASGAPVSWAASPGAAWLRLSRTSGILAPGRSVTVQVTIDPAREPEGAWTARIALHPSGAVVQVSGYKAPPATDPPKSGGRPGHARPHRGHGGPHHGQGGQGATTAPAGPTDPATPPPDQQDPPSGGASPLPPPPEGGPTQGPPPQPDSTVSPSV
jgi:DNA-directed RNA polymerase specialized sigma24 family protein